MKITFYFLVPNKKTQGVIYNEGIAVLSAIAKEKGTVTALQRLDLGDLRRGIHVDPTCDVHALSFASRQFSLARQLVEQIAQRKDKGLIIAGGIHSTVARESVIEPSDVDMVVSGEGEPAFQWLLDFPDVPLHQCGLPNVHVKGMETLPLQKSDYVDPNLLPYPDRALFDKNLLQNAPEFIFSRGCPFSCGYCANEFLNSAFGKKVRRKTPEYCMAELDNAFGTLDIASDTILTFHDDVFLSDFGWLEAFGKLYRKSFSNPFRCNTTASLVTEEKVRFLKEINCREIWVGVETGSEELRAKVLRKKISNEQIVRAFDNINKHGLRGISFIMLGCPGETVAHVEETLTLLKRCKIYLPTVSMFTPFPGTTLYREAVMEDNVREFTEEENDSVSSSGLKRKNLTDEEYAYYADLIHFLAQSPLLYYLVRGANMFGVSSRQLKRLQSVSPTFVGPLRRALRRIVELFLRKRIDFDRSDK